MNRNMILASAASVLLFTSCGNQQETTSAPDTKEVSAAKESSKPLSDQLVMSTLWFQQSLAADLAFEQAYELASQKLAENMQRYRSSKTPAVILDIDETVLDNSPYEARLIEQGENFAPATWADWVNEARAELLPGVKAFLTKASTQGVEVYYVSNRSEDLLAPTLENLQQFGLPNVDADHVLLKKDTSDKTKRREKIKEKHQVLLLMGDQPGDFIENFEKAYHSRMRDSLRQSFIILPNPMYGSFESEIYKEKILSDSAKSEARKKALDTKQ